MLDTTSPIETPEGVGIDLRLAGPPIRALAWFLDFLLKVGFCIGISIVMLFLGGIGEAALMLIFFVLEWFYPILFEIFWKGQTPGKRAMGVAVVMADGTPVGWGPSILRNLLRAADLMPLVTIGFIPIPVYGFGLITCLVTRRFQRMGDLLAGTLVVYETGRTVKTVELPTVSPIAPPCLLSLSEQRALISFRERSPNLSEGRQAELGDILIPLTGKTGMKGVANLNAFAAWLMGSRK